MAQGIVQVVNLVDADVHGSPTRSARLACKIARASRTMVKHECFPPNLDFARTITDPKMGLESLISHEINSTPRRSDFFRRRVAPENEGPMRYECRCLASPVSGSVRPLAERVAGSGNQDHITLERVVVPTPSEPKGNAQSRCPGWRETAPSSGRDSNQRYRLPRDSLMTAY